MHETNKIKYRLLYAFDYLFDYCLFGIIWQSLLFRLLLLLLLIILLSLVIAVLIEENNNNNKKKKNNNNIDNNNSWYIYYVVNRLFGLSRMEVEMTFMVKYFIIDTFSVFKQLILLQILTLMYVCKDASVDGTSIEDKETNIDFGSISTWICYRSLLDHISATYVLVKHSIIWFSKDGLKHNLLNLERSQQFILNIHLFLTEYGYIMIL